jgi:hypothetical protein
LIHKNPILPGEKGNKVKNIHLGTNKDSDKYKWAEAGILRRNAILRTKFHCQDFSFIDEFFGFRKWEFLESSWKPNPNPFRYTRQDRKPDMIRNPNPGKPLNNL